MNESPAAGAAGDPDVPTAGRGRVVELGLLFGLAPVLLALGPRWMVSLGILASGLLCLVLLLRDPTFPRQQLFGIGGARRGLGRVVLRTAIVWGALLLVTALARPGSLFLFPRTRPGVWLAVMLLYPVSAYAQEIACRTFFFHRYRALFTRPTTRILASGAIFGWAHVAVNNVLAVLLGTVAGILFADTYERSRSTLLVSLEHALYGDFVFTVGLGSLFYSTARWVAAGH